MAGRPQKRARQEAARLDALQQKQLAKRTPRPAAVALLPEVLNQETLVDSGDNTAVAQQEMARLEAAIAEAQTGGNILAAAKRAGLPRSAFERELARANRDQYAITRDTARLRVINQMYDLVGKTLDKISGMVDDEESLGVLLLVIDKLGLRLSCIENGRISVAEELVGAASKPGGVSRVRTVVEEIRGEGNLTVNQQQVLDELLGISTPPSSGTRPMGTLYTSAPKEGTQH